MTSSDHIQPAHRPFGEDYPDPRSAEALRSERAEAAEQVRRTIAYATDQKLITSMFEKIQQRRAGVEPVAIAKVPAQGGGEVFVDPNSFLLPPHTAPVAALAELRAAAPSPFTFAEVNQRTGFSLVRPTPSAPRPAAAEVGLAPFVDLRAAQPEVEVNHIVALGGVVKAGGGPEPTALRREFPAVRYATTGEPVQVAIIDTGVPAKARDDGYLAGLAQGDNIDPLDEFPVPQPGTPGPRGDGLLDASAGHGTHVSGVVQQVAPSARIRVYRAVDSDGCATDFEIGQAITRAGQDGADIINLSLGSPTVNDRAQPAIRAAIEGVVADNPDVLVVCAAGNNGGTRPEWPAALSAEIPNVVSVGGLDAQGMPSTWSTHGDWVTCSTVGEGIASTYVEGSEDGPLINDPHPDTYGPDSWAIWTGTSFAAPQIVGGVARRSQETGLRPRAALDDLLAQAPETEGWGKRVIILPGT